MHAPGRSQVVVTVALLSLLWGTTWAAIRVGLEGMPPLTGVALRFAVASVALLLVARAVGGRFEGSRREKALWVSNGLLSFCVSYGIIYWGEQWVPSGLASVLFATFPLFVALLAHLTLPDERLRWATFAGVLMGFVGVAVIFSEDLSKLGGPGVAFASAVILVAPFVSAVSNVAIKKWGKGLHPFSLTAVPMGLAAGVMGAIAVVTERGRPIVWDAPTVGALLYLAIPGSAVTFTLYYWLLSHLPATRVSLIAYTTPVVAVAVGALLMDEPYTGRMLSGTALVLAGVAMASSPTRRPPARRVGGGSAALLLFLLVSAIAARPAAAEDAPLLLPSDAAPEAVRHLGSLAGSTAVAFKADGSVAVAAFPVPGDSKGRSMLRRADAAASVREVRSVGEWRALAFTAAGAGPYGVLARPQRKGSPREVALALLDLGTLEVADEVRLPSTAFGMAAMLDGNAFLVACRNELRVVTVPDLRSPRLYRVLGDNLAVAMVPGTTRVLVGQPGGLVLVDLGDRQGPDGLPIRERVATARPVLEIATAPDGAAALARLSGGNTYDVRFDPLAIVERGVSEAVFWPGESQPAPVEAPPEPEPPVAEPQQPPPPVAEPEPEVTERAAPAPEPEPPVAAPQQPPPPIAEPEPEVSERAAPAPEPPAAGFIEGRVTGAADRVRAVVLLGPDNLLREAMRVVPEADGAWRAGPLAPGAYRVVLDAGADEVVVSEPAFARVVVVPGEGATAPEMRVVRTMRP